MQGLEHTEHFRHRAVDVVLLGQTLRVLALSGPTPIQSTLGAFSGKS